MLPLAIPDFVISYGWVSVAPSVHGFRGAVLVMTLALYPLVYLPGRGEPARRPIPRLEDVARGLGLGRIEHLRARDPRPDPRRHPRRLRCSSRCAVLAEYGTFEILRFQTFTTEIYTEFGIGFRSRPRARCRSCSC